LFFGPMGFLGLAVATSAAGWLNAGLLAFTLRRRKLLPIDRRLSRSLPRVILASALMALAVWALVAFGEGWIAPTAGLVGAGWAAVIALFAVSGAGAIVYAGACFVTGAIKPREIAEAMKPRAVPQPEMQDDPGA
ncbi:MAG: polysaccharide biosynthesis C-terminal domain-containing protein, partial [Oceanicaulis sp.]